MPGRGCYAVILVGLLLLAGDALAQRGGRPHGDRPERPAAECPGRPDRPASQPWVTLPHGRLRELLEPRPEDFGPLTDDERVQLLQFVEREMPEAYRMLMMLRERRPEQFEEKLERLAPRARHLRRIHNMSPPLARILRDHAVCGFRTQRLCQRMQHLPPDSWRREHALGRLRDLQSETVDLELEALRVLSDEIEAHLAERVAQRLDTALAADDAALAAAPPAVRQLVEQYRSLPEDERDAARTRLQTLFEDRALGDVVELRARREELSARADEQVAARMEQLAERCAYDEQARRGRGHRRGPWRGDSDVE
jgi:hypothetical protein